MTPFQMMPRGLLARSWRWLGLIAAAWSSGCELSEVTVAEGRDIVVAEVYVQLGQSASRATAFLHRTETQATDGLVRDADVRVTLDGGAVIQLLETDVEECLVSDQGTPAVGTCYAAPAIQALLFTPGDTVALSIQLAEGGQLLAETVIPEDFQLVSPAPLVCSIPPLENHLVEWTSASGAWAYLNETRIDGLTEALADQPIDAEDDPLDLLGVSVSASDTTIVFPSEFGLFDRFELDRDLAILLQQGLPEGTSATVLIGAVDRNWVNWVRGGNFNPSGQVRVPSVRGDGTGVFGAAVVRTAVFSAKPENDLPPCGPQP